MINIDALANEIRRLNGNNNLGAGELAEKLQPFIIREFKFAHNAKQRQEILNECIVEFTSLLRMCDTSFDQDKNIMDQLKIKILNKDKPHDEQK